MAKIPIVDRDDTIIGFKERDELDLAHDIVRSASVWITNNKGEVLLAQRKLTKRVDPGKWAEAVGGTVENEDSYEETAYREAEEELGIKNIEFHLGPKQFVTGLSNSYFVQWYYAVVDWPLEQFIPQESEVEGIAWWDLNTLRQELHSDPNRYIAALPDMIELLAK